MPLMQRLRTCSRPLPTLFTASCRLVVANTNQPFLCSSKPIISRAVIHQHHSRRQRSSQRLPISRLFSSNSASSNESTIKQQVHSLFQSATLFLPRVIAFCGTIHVTTEYGFNTVSCEGPSMEPTIIDGSFTCVLIDKFSHRIFGLEKNNDEGGRNSHSKFNCSTTECCSEKQDAETENDDDNTWISLLKGVWEQHFSSGLQRGDVVIMHHPSKEATICKRIIGMPGDTIIRTDGGSRESNHRVKVSPGHLWIEGDNTLQSHDSRAYGAVPASLIVGKVVCRLWPLREYASLGLDANGMEHWQRIRGRIGRVERPMPLKKNEGFEGSHVLRERKC